MRCSAHEVVATTPRLRQMAREARPDIAPQAGFCQGATHCHLRMSSLFSRAGVRRQAITHQCGGRSSQPAGRKAHPCGSLLATATWNPSCTLLLRGKDGPLHFARRQCFLASRVRDPWRTLQHSMGASSLQRALQPAARRPNARSGAHTLRSAFRARTLRQRGLITAPPTRCLGGTCFVSTTAGRRVASGV